MAASQTRSFERTPFANLNNLTKSDQNLKLVSKNLGFRAQERQMVTSQRQNILEGIRLACVDKVSRTRYTQAIVVWRGERATSQLE